MKKLSILLLPVLVSAFLLFSGCGKNKNDGDGGITGIPNITSADYDWNILFLDYTMHDDKTSEYQIRADWLGDSSAITEDDTFTIDINGVSLEFLSEYDSGSWSIQTMANLEPGTQYDLVFKKNSSTVASEALRMPYQASVNFPVSFDPNESTTMNWQMEENNKYQLVRLLSESDYGGDDWEEAISVSDRSFSFPVNAIGSYGFNTEYSMMLVQMNFEKSSRVAFSSISISSKDYKNDPGIPDITPADYDWDILFLDYSMLDDKASEYRISADWLGDSSGISGNDIFTIDINSVSLEFSSEYNSGSWSFQTMANLNPGAQYNLVFKKNGNTVASKSLRMPYHANVSFPDSLDPSGGTTMNWQMAENNKYQLVSLCSKTYYDEDDWEEYISVSDRSFTFPVNAFESYGIADEYAMMLTQMNFEESSRVAFSAISLASKNYKYELGIPDITPANYDWDITLMSSDFKSADYMVWADWLGNSAAITADDEFTLVIDGYTHEFMGGYDEGDWSFFLLAEFVPGTQYNMVFKKNGYEVASKTLRIPYEPTVTFPSTFDPTKTAKMTWQMSGDNQYQVASLYAGDNDEYNKNIAASARTYTFPKDAVSSTGADSEYGMMLTEINFETAGRVAFSSFSFTMQEYGNGVPVKFEASNLRKIAKDLRQRIK